MVGRRQINLSKIASASRQQRIAAREPVREERLRTGDDLVAWRGHSGRRYVFKTSDVEACPVPQGHAVVAAVVREGDVTRLIDVAHALDPEDFQDWRRDARESGASEIQVCRLCAHEDEAAEMVMDLGFDVGVRRPYGLGF